MYPFDYLQGRELMMNLVEIVNLELLTELRYYLIEAPQEQAN